MVQILRNCLNVHYIRHSSGIRLMSHRFVSSVMICAWHAECHAIYQLFASEWSRVHEMSKTTFVVDKSVAVDICLANHLVDFVVGQLLAECHHHLSQLAGWDVAVSVLVKHLERLAKLDLLVLWRLHLPQHHRHELVEVDRSVTCTTTGRPLWSSRASTL